ncbi:MAG: hypothetical protein E2O68_02705 [Deltaproteobacteria bacterium]|nr:MAG: hypothetical protein E2O68_02705 [Deltaproteobacteria bacterium]
MHTRKPPRGPCMVSAEGACGAYYHWHKKAPARIRV